MREKILIRSLWIYTTFGLIVTPDTFPSLTYGAPLPRFYPQRAPFFLLDNGPMFFPVYSLLLSSPFIGSPMSDSNFSNGESIHFFPRLYSFAPYNQASSFFYRHNKPFPNKDLFFFGSPKGQQFFAAINDLLSVYRTDFFIRFESYHLPRRVNPPPPPKK